MNKEAIEARLLELKKQLENVQANGNALLGAIQDCEYWLAMIEKNGSSRTDSGEGHATLSVTR